MDCTLSSGLWQNLTPVEKYKKQDDSFLFAFGGSKLEKIFPTKKPLFQQTGKKIGGR
jgi:hypothetical protein